MSHDNNSINAIIVEKSSDILSLTKNPEIVAIDEAQFFTDDLADTCNKLAAKGIRVIVAGLDMDFLGVPFGEIPNLLAIAEHVTKVHAICQDCGAIANYSFRTITRIIKRTKFRSRTSKTFVLISNINIRCTG